MNLRKAWPSEYSSWLEARRRCNKPHNQRYHHYGGRGIRMCPRWDSFRAFLDDMGAKPDYEPRHWQLDRIDNDGNYEPGNCRWATAQQQSLNKRRVHLVTRDGVTLPLNAWAAHLGLGKNGIYERLRNGWSIEKALSVPGPGKKRAMSRAAELAASTFAACGHDAGDRSGGIP